MQPLEGTSVRVLFVCAGNICRSPMAEAVFMHKVRAAGLDSIIHADSAGTGAWYVGSAPHKGTRSVLERRGIPWSHRARVITAADLASFDYVLTMDEENFHDVAGLGSALAKVARLLDYAPLTGLREVPDPYYSGLFDDTYKLLDVATDSLLAAIVKEHEL